METAYVCKTAGCQLQGQSGAAGLCSGCGNPTWPLNRGVRDAATTPPALDVLFAGPTAASSPVATVPWRAALRIAGVAVGILAGLCLLLGGVAALAPSG